MLRNLLIFIAGTLILAALLTPWAYLGLGIIIPDHSYPFSRVYNRVAMLSALFWLVVFRKHFNANSIKDILYTDKYLHNMFKVTLGVLVAFASVIITVYSMLAITFDLSLVAYETEILLNKSIKFLLTGILVGVIEETFFRGIIFNYLKNKNGIVYGAIISSTVYSLVHFIVPASEWQSGAITALSGISYLTAVLTQMFSTTNFPAMFGLFLVGVVLAYVYHKTKSIYYCIGLHAGWVLSLKLTRLVTDPANAPEPTGALAPYYLVAMPLAWASIVSVAVVFYFVAIIRSKDLAENMQD